MEYNFDEIIDRRGTDCVKHDRMGKDFGCDERGLLAMWVADMDFRSPKCVIDAIKRRAEHEVLGYSYATDHYLEAVQQWLAKHYGIDAQYNELHFVPGIVAGISFALEAFTKASDKVLMLTPVYPPFINLPRGSNREIVCSHLKIEDGRFAIDFDDMDEKAKGCKMLIFANPHNPGGTVWDSETLSKVAEICQRHNIVVIDDEIHADLTLPGYRHRAYPTLSELAANQCLTFYAPSKTFNIAGLSSSVCYTHNPELRKQYFGYLDTFEVANGNIFAFVGAEAAYRHGEEWLQAMLQYLSGNVEYARQYFATEMPELKAIMPEASYLAWLDFSNYNHPHDETMRRLLERGRVALNDGTTFGGSQYANCFRLNLGCPRATLHEALERIKRSMR